MTISRVLAWILLCLTLVGSSLVRQLHVFIPEWAPLPWPIRSPLYIFLVLLFLIVAFGSGRASPVASTPRPGRVPLAWLAPLLLALVYEKVLSITLYEALLDHTIRVSWMRDHLDAWIHLVIGTGMTLAVLLLVPILRHVSISDFTMPARLRAGFYLQMVALIATYAFLAGLTALVGGRENHVTLLFTTGVPVVLLALGQGLRAMSEEFYYRGLLQRELNGLMHALGVRSRRNGQALAVAMISFGFGIEHFRFGAPLSESYKGFAYAMAVGFLFGYLLILTGNVFFCGLVHATNNFVSAGVMPRLGTADQVIVLSPDTFLYVYLVAVFVLVFMFAAIPRGNLRRVFFPDTDPPMHA
ncbi:MAG: CPBP family intramembrane glutamic endopeptidase [Acidobacteriota bacterium]